jgi:hypothetical protein
MFFVVYIRLHDYYRFNATELVKEGAITLGQDVFPTTGDLSVWDAFKIGSQPAYRTFLKRGPE